MTAPEQKRERTAGWVLGGWLLLHQFLLADSGLFPQSVVFLLCAGILLRIFGVFPPVQAGWLLLAGAAVVSLLVPKPSIAGAGGLGTLFGAVLLLRPLSPRRGLWILLCAVSVLAAITLQESETVNTVFVVVDVAVLMFVAQQIHAPAEADAAVWASVLRSLRLILPVALIVTLVFWLFPAISSHTSVAFVGFSGGDLLSPGEVSEIRLTRRVAFVATFPESSAVPAFSDLYWRGQVLEKNDGLRWSVEPARINLLSKTKGHSPDTGKWRYSQLLAPDRTLAALDRPVSVTASTNAKRATVLETGPSAFSVLGTGDLAIDIVSSSVAPDDPPLMAVASGDLDVPEKIRDDPRLKSLASRVFPPASTLSNKLESLGHFLASGGYAYTLRPGKMEGGDVAWFLFHHRKGFCGLYAAAAANILRAGGIPSRVVTGFRGGTWNPWLRTITVRDSDAHAWIEAWDENAGHWARFDPTSFVAPELSARLELERDPDRWPWFRLATTYASTVLARTWNGMESALSLYALPVSWKALIAIVGLVAAIRWIATRRKSPPDPAASCLAKLEKQAALKCRPRLPGETPLAWLARLECISPSAPEAVDLRKIAACYESLVYAPAGRLPENVAALKSACRRLARIWRGAAAGSCGSAVVGAGARKDADKTADRSMLETMTRKTAIWVLVMSVCAVLAGGVVVWVSAVRHVRAFFVEDKIHGAYFPLTSALYTYQQERGHPAESLAALVPNSLPAIPSSTLTGPPAYRVLPGGQSWELALHSRALSRPRLYVCRSTQEFSPEEERRMVARYHGTWAVFPDDR